MLQESSLPFGEYGPRRPTIYEGLGGHGPHGQGSQYQVSVDPHRQGPPRQVRPDQAQSSPEDGQFQNPADSGNFQHPADHALLENPPDLEPSQHQADRESSELNFRRITNLSSTS